MGVKFGREYNEILRDLTEAISQVDRVYECLYMDGEAWNALAAKDREECMRTLADDLFYGLGGEPIIPVGKGKIYYNKRKHIIAVDNGENRIDIIYLI